MRQHLFRRRVAAFILPMIGIAIVALLTFSGDGSDPLPTGPGVEVRHVSVHVESEFDSGLRAEFRVKIWLDELRDRSRTEYSAAGQLFYTEYRRGDSLLTIYAVPEGQEPFGPNEPTEQQAFTGLEFSLLRPLETFTGSRWAERAAINVDRAAGRIVLEDRDAKITHSFDPASGRLLQSTRIEAPGRSVSETGGGTTRFHYDPDETVSVEENFLVPDAPRTPSD